MFKIQWKNGNPNSILENHCESEWLRRGERQNKWRFRNSMKSHVLPITQDLKSEYFQKSRTLSLSLNYRELTVLIVVNSFVGASACFGNCSNIPSGPIVSQLQARSERRNWIIQWSRENLRALCHASSLQPLHVQIVKLESQSELGVGDGHGHKNLRFKEAFSRQMLHLLVKPSGAQNYSQSDVASSWLSEAIPRQIILRSRISQNRCPLFSFPKFFKMILKNAEPIGVTDNAAASSLCHLLCHDPSPEEKRCKKSNPVVSKASGKGVCRFVLHGSDGSVVE